MMSKPVVGAKAPPTAPPPQSAASSMAQRSWNALRRVRRATTGSLALVGLGAVATVAYEWNQMKQVEEDGLDEKTKETKKRVLVIPFHRMTLVERKKNSFDGRSLANLADAEDRMMEVQISDLVQVIHAAAQDPSIVALYGIFGHGFTFRAGGWAHIEEIRNALKVWREAHRSHLEPNLMHDKTLVRRSNATPKPSFAFADSFADPDDKGNKEYLLACAFSHIHMQKNGELNLFGVSSSSPFFRSFMEKYGIKAHVFKHGKFKNFPNMFTENGYTREHAQNVEQMVDQIDRNNRNAVTADRNQKGFDNFVWKMIRNLGSITGPEMLKLGLVDHLATLDPLDGLLQSNQENKDKTGGDNNNKEAMKQKWGNETDMDKFEATEQVTFSKYLSTLGKRKKMEQRKHKMYSSLQKAADKSSAFAATLGLLGYSAPYYNLKKEEYSEGQEANEKIAVVNIQGSINADVARKTVASLRKIKKDDKVKAVILRLDTPGGSVTASESILQECKDMPQPCIASMGNVCASGGYYVATGCKQIFALPTTITGSIGVFAIKFDLTGLAKKYGISVKHTTTGPYSASFHPFKPLNSLVKTNLNNNVDRYYDYFKSIVAESRSLNLKEVEELAQGKVWTGGQAKLNGLVDELGGLERAVSFAQRQYTDGGVAQVERWPKQEGILEKLQRVAETDSSSVGNTLMAMVQVLRQEINSNSSQDSNDSSVPEMNEYDATKFLIQAITNNPRSIESMKLGGVSLTMDESAAMSHLVSENVQRLQQDQLLHPSFWNTR